GVAGWRHHGDKRDVAAGERAHAVRQRDIAQVLRIIDLKPADIDLDAVRDRVGEATHFDGMRNDADCAAALDAGRLIGAAHANRNVDPDGGAFAQPHEIHVQRHVAHGIELEIARDDAVLYAVDLNLMDGGEEAAGIDALAQFGVVERNRQWRLAIAIDDAGDAASATLGPGGPLACPRACRRLDLIDGRHRVSSS